MHKDNMSSKTIEPIGVIKNGYNEKFGVPRQSGLAPSVKSEILFLPRYRDKNFVRGIEQYSHLWLIWGFNENEEKEISPTVRPPKLGGNKRVGVFATRSPFRPNGLGLSCVKLEEVIEGAGGVSLVVSGADLKNDTPIYDIKPYIPYADCINDAKGGFAEDYKDDRVEVIFQENVQADETLRMEIEEVLSLDPKPSYRDDDKVYGMSYKEFNVKFRYDDGKIIVINVVREEK